LVGCRDPGCAVPGGREGARTTRRCAAVGGRASEHGNGNGSGSLGGPDGEGCGAAAQAQKCSSSSSSSSRRQPARPGRRALAEFKAVAHSRGDGPALTSCLSAGVRAAASDQRQVSIGDEKPRAKARPRPGQGQEPKAKAKSRQTEPSPARPDGRRPSAAVCSSCCCWAAAGLLGWAAAGGPDLRYGALFYDVLTMALHGALYVWTCIGGGRWRAVAACRCQH
jgi:hypothetical protein